MHGLASLLVLYDFAIVLFSRLSVSANVSNLLSCLITVLLVNVHFSIMQVCFGSILHGLLMDTQYFKHSTVHFRAIGFTNFVA